MNILKILPSYLLWHYSVSLVEYIGVFRNIIWSEYRLFSMGTLLKTLFSPWHRMNEGYKKGFDMESFAETFILNTLLRIIGFIMRTLVIILGIITIIGTTFVGFIILGIWVFMPAITLGLFIHSLSILIR